MKAGEGREWILEREAEVVRSIVWLAEVVVVKEGCGLRRSNCLTTSLMDCSHQPLSRSHLFVDRPL